MTEVHSYQKTHNVALMAMVLECSINLVCHHSKYGAILKWFWSFSTNLTAPEITPIVKFQTLCFTIYIHRGNKQHLTQAFFPGTGGTLGMRGLDICVYHMTTKAWNMKTLILRRLTKNYEEVMVDKCPPQALSKQLLDSFTTVMFSRHNCL